MGQLVVSDTDTFPNGALFTYNILSGNPDFEFRVHSDGTLYTAARLSTRVRTVYYLQVRVIDSGFPPLHTDSWVTVKVLNMKNVLKVRRIALLISFKVIALNNFNHEAVCLKPIH